MGRLVAFHAIDRQLHCSTGAVLTREIASEMGSVLSKQDRVVLPATPENTEAIRCAWTLKARGVVASVMVCSPELVADAVAAKSPKKVLMATLMAVNRLSPSLGGPHELTDTEKLCYDMAHFDRLGRIDKMMDAYGKHPVSTLMTALTPRDDESIARTMGNVRDPRWFVNTKVNDLNPATIQSVDSEAKLRLYLGLAPRVMNRLAANKMDVRSTRLAAALSCWLGEDKPTADQCSPFQSEFVAAGSDGRAALRTGQRFVSFLRALWLHVIYEGRYDLIRWDEFFDAEAAAENAVRCRDFFACRNA